jgi:pimeloyl-ACP methyl ester carboxylesterase
MSMCFPVESLLAARLFLDPKLVGDRLYFVSDLSGRLSLYAMDAAGSVPEPLLPPNVALQNPHLMDGGLYHVLPGLGKVLIMLDNDGDENYQPMFIPLQGGIPERVFGDRYPEHRLYIGACDPDRALFVFTVEKTSDPVYRTIRTDLNTISIEPVGQSPYGNFCQAANKDFDVLLLADMITFGDDVLYVWQGGDRQLVFGTPPDQREAGRSYPPNGLRAAAFADGGFLNVNALIDDSYGLGYLDPKRPEHIEPVEIKGIRHQGLGELESISLLGSGRYRLTYNIDGCSWVYDGTFDRAGGCFEIDEAICGAGRLEGGVLEAIHYDKASGRSALSFSTATSPSQLYVLDPTDSGTGLTQLTHERVLGIPLELLSPGEDASFESHDGLRISARLYRPAAALGYDGARPLVVYIHGGPQSQERPDFTWFSMPLIQFFTLNGFAVFVPNTRGSTGYGLSFMKRIDHDWGGLDRLDHVAALQQLEGDPELDTHRAGVMGRSYGGYMTLTLVGRHPDLFKAACDMFGPYDLFSFLERIPETWKTYFHSAIGHPDTDREHLLDRSPSTHIGNLACPLLVIQGANDPRVVEQESSDLVNSLRAQGKQVEYLVFEDEGHDVIKYDNKVTCYTRIVDFFHQHLDAETVR